jgi:glutaredoxin
MDEKGVAYEYINVEEVDGAADKVKEINGGAQSIPVIIFSDGTHLTEPSDNDLEAKLKELSIL